MLKQNYKTQYSNFVIFQVQMIYFGDPQLVEKHLHQDLNSLIKNVKIREQQHLQLLEYNKGIINKKRSIQTTIFINDQITTHNKFLQKVLNVNKEIIKQEEQIIQKYDSAAVKYQSVMKLMARVITRIIQTNQTYIEKIKAYDQNFNDQFNKMKNILTKLVNNKQNIDIGLGTKTIIQYTKNKAVNQIEKLKLLIKSLQDGQIQKIPYIYKGTKPPEPSQKIQAIIKVEKPIQKKSSSPPKKQQKHQMVNKIKQQIKLQQKNKKNKKNLANKLITMYSTMDLSKKQFIQDMVYSNQKEQFQRIYGEIFLRNKFNHEQILEFQSKKQSFQQKVRMFKEIMIEESNKIQEVLMIKKPNRIQRKQDIHSESASKIEPYNEQNKNPESGYDESSPTNPKKGFVLRQKVVTPKFHKQTDMANLSQMRITQDGFNHIKFDTSNHEIFLRSNRNRLPSIQPKPVSGSTDNNQHRYHLSKPKQQKITRKNFLMKNIEVGVQNVIKQNQNKNHSQSKNIAQKLKEIHPAASLNTNNLMDLTFYGSKKKSYALGQTRTNFAF